MIHFLLLLGVNDTVVNQLLSKIDGVDQLNNILVIGMTNRLVNGTPSSGWPTGWSMVHRHRDDQQFGQWHTVIGMLYCHPKIFKNLTFAGAIKTQTTLEIIPHEICQ